MNLYNNLIVALIIFINIKYIGNSNNGLIENSKSLIKHKQLISIRNDENFKQWNRGTRFFPFYSVVRFENSICLGNCQLTGTCYTRKECRKYGGVSSGTCAKGLGVCCIVKKTCGGVSNVNNTYFQNPQFPGSYIGSTRCAISITRCNANICQLRLDFLSFELAQPNAVGVCVTDSFTVTGGASTPPVICGENTGQHMYIDFDGDEPIQLTIRTNAASSFPRTWNIKATQIACDCPLRAPSGCLMYYTALSGTVRSFNYGDTVNIDANGNIGTRQLVNNRYGICIEMSPNYCSIEWSSTTTDSFQLSGTADVGELRGTDCQTDFVIIPDPVNNVFNGTDRFCGSMFITKTSNIKPFVLYVVTNGDEDGDVGNRGFSLNYVQRPCTQ